MKAQLSFFTLIVLSLACQPVAEKAPIQQGPQYSADVREIIEAKNQSITQAYLSGIIDSAAVHFAENCIQMPPNSPALRGRQNFIDGWSQNIAFGEWDLSLEVKEVKAVENIATELGTYTLKFTPNESSPIPPMEDYGNYVVVWEKIDGDWKILWDAPVSEVPLPMPESMDMPVVEE